jgi:uncharacterized protein HemY
LLGDRAYIMLLLGNYQEAENHARRAMLWETDSERAYYLAAEACYCSGERVAGERAKSYASDYYKKVAERTKTPATPKLNIPAFTALCTDLKVCPPVP